MPQLLSSKQYQDLAEDLQKIVKNATTEERVETIAERTANIIDVIGDFETFDLTEMEGWRARLKFEIHDSEPKDDEERDMRGIIAMSVPEMAALMIARSRIIIYQQKQEEWIDITEEFSERCSHDLRWRKE